jgi:hypothetical protein
MIKNDRDANIKDYFRITEGYKTEYPLNAIQNVHGKTSGPEVAEKEAGSIQPR